MDHTHKGDPQEEAPAAFASSWAEVTEDHTFTFTINFFKYKIKTYD